MKLSPPLPRPGRRFIPLGVVLGVVLSMFGLTASMWLRGGETQAHASTEDRFWRTTFFDDFSDPALNLERWSPYSGQPGGDPNSWWDPRHVTVRDSKLTLEAYERDGRIVTGGVSNWPITQLYGKWEVRMRADASDEVTFHLLLWPKAENWPPEIDFAESFGGPRNYVEAFLHWRDLTGAAHKRKQALEGDFTTWQTLGVEWLPGLIRYTINGRVWGVETGPEVPNEPMWLGIQSQAGGCAKAAEYGMPACPWVGTPERANIEVDWVRVAEPAVLP